METKHTPGPWKASLAAKEYCLRLAVLTEIWATESGKEAKDYADFWRHSFAEFFFSDFNTAPNAWHRFWEASGQQRCGLQDLIETWGKERVAAAEAKARAAIAKAEGRA